MRKSRGLSSAVGTVFLVIIVIGALSYVTYSMNLLGNFSESLITEEKRQQNKQAEEFEITSVEITPGLKLDGVVENTGQIPLEIKSLWIEEVGTPNSVKKFDIDTTIAPGNQLDLSNNVDFDMDPTKGYTMKMISGRGEIQTFHINSVGSTSLYLNSHVFPATISTEFDTTILLTVTNNSTSNAPILNLTPDAIDVDTTACSPDCIATYVSGPTPSSYPIIKQGETATFAWVYTVSGEDANQVTFTTSLLNGVTTNTAAATVEVRDIVSALESGTALTSVGLSTSSIDKSILLFHQETDRTPSTSYQMFSATADGGANGLKVELDTTIPNFFTQNGSSIIDIPAGNWISSLRLQSEAMPNSLIGEGEDMIFHFNTNDSTPNNSEGTTAADLEGCGANTFAQRILTGNDDAEEDTSDGTMDRGNSDLEMAQDGSTVQIVGLRFTGIPIPQGSTIQSAYIQFTTDEAQTGTTVNVRIYGHDTDDAGAITSTNLDLTNRTNTSAFVNWSAIPAWSTVPETGANQKTPDIKTVIQEIVDRGGWSSGNDIVIKIVNNASTSSTRRTAEPYEGGSTLAPELQITYSPSAGYGGAPTYNATAGPHTSGAFHFDGQNDCFRSLNNVSTNDNNDILAAPDNTALWFKTFTTIGATDQYLVAWEGTGTCPACDHYRISLEASSGKIRFQYNMGTGGSADNVLCKSTGRYDDSNWYHLVAVRPTEISGTDYCNLHIHRLNGTSAESVIVNSTASGSTSVDTDGRWYIASNGAENGNFFNGWVDDVMHWNDAGEVLDFEEANDLSHVDYGLAAHKLTLYIDKSDSDGVNLSNLVSVINATVPFYDPLGSANEDLDSTYGVFNYTSALGTVTLSAQQRLNYTISYVPNSTSTWKNLGLDMKIDDRDITPMTSLLQIPPPNDPFPSYWVYDKSDRLRVPVYNIGPYGSWFVYQGTRAVFDSPTGSTSYAAIICAVNSTSVDYCSTGTHPDYVVTEHRDSIFIPIGSIGNVYFWNIESRPDANVGGTSTLIPAGEYDMFVFIDGYDETGAKFLRQMEMGRVRVQD